MEKKLREQYDFISELTRSKDFTKGNLNALSRSVVGKVSTLLNIRRVGIWFFDERFETLNSYVLIDNNKIQENITIHCSDFPIYTNALRSKRSIVANNVFENKDLQELIEVYIEKIGASSMLDSAIRNGEEIIGVFCLEHIGQQRKWTLEEISFAGVLSDLLSQSIILKEMKEGKRNLEKKSLELEESNIALKNILSRFEEEKKVTKENIATNIEKNLRPIIVELKKNKHISSETISKLETGIDNLSSGFYQRLAQFKVNLSPAEVKVCQMISTGYQGKEIADLLKISFSTVETHKKNIRKKLNLTGKSVNLKVFLEELSL
ncbi:MAG: DNA-binding NarL/FixJ family response regulator [Bacteriovoracaceae bacterium]|jgi:DNA-binding NarL/FixJ family response regulator